MQPPDILGKWAVGTGVQLVSQHQGCGSKYIEFGSGSRILAQFRSGSGYRVMLLILKKIIILEENSFL